LHLKKLKSNRLNIVRDISWLSFNERVLQEAKDPSVHLNNRLKFLGIFSNNLDEFFRVRVGTLNKMLKLEKNAKMHFEDDPEKILKKIQEVVLEQQINFDSTYAEIINQLEIQHKVFFKNEKQLSKDQKSFVQHYFEDKVRTQIVPLMIESMPQAPFLKDRSIYLACVLGNTQNPMLQRYALIQIPEKEVPRFVIIPSPKNETHIILLDDIIRYNLKYLFAPFGFNRFSSHIVKLTRDAELELDNDLNNNVIGDLEKSLKNRNKGKATRFVYDRSIDPHLLDYLTKRLNLLKKDNLIAGGRIHNFKDFMDFPKSVFNDLTTRPKSFVHPLLEQPCRIMEVLEKRDVMLHFPYHSFDSIIDLLREAAIDPSVQSIKITAYRLAKQSKVINALLNAVRNGKQVTVVIELRARFDEEANLYWKSVLEEEGIKVLLGVPDMKVHAKICVIKKREFNKNHFHYEFRWFWDYAGGLMCDWGVHLMDIMLWGMGANEPKSVSATGGKRIFPDDARETPDYLNVTYDFGNFSNTWEHYMGTGAGQYGRGHGIAFIGTKGTLVVNRSGWEVIAENGRMESVPLALKSDIGLDLHAQNFVDVIKSGKKEDLACPIYAGARVAINAHMGNMAHRTGEKIDWNAEKGLFVQKAANHLIKPTYHNGFVYPKF